MESTGQVVTFMQFSTFSIKNTVGTNGSTSVASTRPVAPTLDGVRCHHSPWSCASRGCLKTLTHNYTLQTSLLHPACQPRISSSEQKYYAHMHCRSTPPKVTISLSQSYISHLLRKECHGYIYANAAQPVLRSGSPPFLEWSLMSSETVFLSSDCYSFNPHSQNSIISFLLTSCRGLQLGWVLLRASAALIQLNHRIIGERQKLCFSRMGTLFVSWTGATIQHCNELPFAFLERVGSVCRASMLPVSKTNSCIQRRQIHLIKYDLELKVKYLK